MIERADGDAMVEFRVYRIRFPADPLSSAGLESILEILFKKLKIFRKETMPYVRSFSGIIQKGYMTNLDY